LGEAAGGEMRLNALGVIAHDGWAWLERHFPTAGVDIFCVMPNHVHAIVSINETAGSNCVQSQAEFQAL
jgi:REP element-mobilizing transposase RayT